jgi:hypothetical protein
VAVGQLLFLVPERFWLSDKKYLSDDKPVWVSNIVLFHDLCNGVAA